MVDPPQGWGRFMSNVCTNVYRWFIKDVHNI